ncbi:MAG: branched-chain amino acid ABC transporter permease [Armatimonadota bacterium]|nr:branched-chain amino acid ABC transporter permease [Armatimonadota bacterium]
MTDRARMRFVIALGIVLLVAPRVLPVYYTHLLILTFIYGMMAMSLDLLMGYTGLTSFGHAAYFGASAYAVGILSVRYHAHFSAAMLGGVLVALIMAVAFGLLAIRATGVYFLIITLALGMGTWGLAYRWASMTGGDNGLPGIPRPELGLPWSMSDPRNLYYFVLVFFVLTGVLLYRLVRSPFGLSLRGIRASEGRMLVLGYNTWIHKYKAFLFAGAFSGLAGALFALYNGFVGPADLHLTASAEGVLMVLLGGPGTLLGPVVGAGLVVFLRNLVSAYTQRWLLILGTVYVLTVMFAPRGVAGAVRDVWARAGERGAARGGGTPSPSGARTLGFSDNSRRNG